MKRITIVASEASYENLRTFETIDQLNETVREYKRLFAAELNPTEIAVLNLLHRYSAKYTGVSFLRKGKIAELIGKSRRTVIRVCNRLEALGIIRQYEIARPTDKRQTSNAIVIQPQKPVETANVTPEATGNVTPNKTTSSLKQNSYVYNTYASQVLPQSITPYVRFKNTVGYFVEDLKLTNKLYGIYLAQTSYIREHHTAEELLCAGLEAVRIAFTATKRKRLRNIAGYFHGTLERLLDRLYEAIVSQASA
jgi:DNA-binding MarR family transcriptional regulator